MAYNLHQRFASSPPYFRLLDPGAYQNFSTPLVKNNNAPFLSKCERKIQSGTKIWTHKIYSTNTESHIPNCTCFMSKIPRFPYETLNNNYDIENIICECEDPNICECESDDKPTPEVICQEKVRRVLYKGATPRSNESGGISAPSKRDRGFEITDNGIQKRVFVKPEKECPPFYDIDVNEFTAFYRGCRWSRRTGKVIEVKDNTPGPAHYTLEHEPSFAKICAERVRFQKRKTCRQLRFIEIVQRRNILDNLPGPSSYSPQGTKGIEFSILGTKPPRSTRSMGPGPADHWLKRDFDPREYPEKLCHASLPSRAPFLSTATRLKTPKIVDLSPASYNPEYTPCKFIRCIKAPFFVSSKRFTEIESESDEDDYEAVDNSEKEKVNTENKNNLSWQFKSKTVRMKPLQKEPITSIPNKIKTSSKQKRLLEVQYSAPFYSSEQRFRPWNNWIATHGKVKTPGPSYYSPEKPKCYPAVSHGPLTRVQRFQSHLKQSPAPNEYKVSNGIETILHTYNERLKHNILNQHTFHWSPPGPRAQLNNEEKEQFLINRSIQLLNSDVSSVNGQKPKTLRCFAPK